MMGPATTRICLSAMDKQLCIEVPTLEGLKQIAEHFHRDVIMEHPYITAAVLLLWSFHPQFPFQALYTVFWVIPRNVVLGILTCFGLRTDPVIRDSYGNQSRYYFVGNSIRRQPGPPPYGAINHDLSTAPHNHPSTSIFWRFVGWIILYASLVVLLKYGGN
ncbi:hypothetical protein CPC08DRAFT_748898 [Agrocybe pediades]|nr:hypothetical protein CPC08DRAFT_748898 [Agrocybe pediades]